MTEIVDLSAVRNAAAARRVLPVVPVDTDPVAALKASLEKLADLTVQLATTVAAMRPNRANARSASQTLRATMATASTPNATRNLPLNYASDTTKYSRATT